MRNILQPGIKQQCREAGVSPGVHRRDRHQSQVLIVEERDWTNPKPSQHRVSETKNGVQGPKPKHGHDDVGEQIRREKQRAKSDRFADPLQQDSEDQTEHQLWGDVVDDIQKGNPHRGPEIFVVQKPVVIGQTDHFGDSQQIPVGKADINCPKRGQEIKDQKSENRWCDKRIGDDYAFIDSKATAARCSSNY
jgi:hypothetical protein